MSLSTNEFSKAIQSLEESVDLFLNAKVKSPEQKAFRDASIQRFEYCIELAWKISMKVLGSNISAAKPAIREMARNNLIKDPVSWLGFVDARNDTSHSYDENVAIKVFAQIQKFLPEAHVLNSELQKINK